MGLFLDRFLQKKNPHHQKSTFESIEVIPVLSTRKSKQPQPYPVVLSFHKYQVRTVLFNTGYSPRMSYTRQFLDSTRSILPVLRLHPPKTTINSPSQLERSFRLSTFGLGTLPIPRKECWKDSMCTSKVPQRSGEIFIIVVDLQFFPSRNTTLQRVGRSMLA